MANDGIEIIEIDDEDEDLNHPVDINDINHEYIDIGNFLFVAINAEADEREMPDNGNFIHNEIHPLDWEIPFNDLNPDYENFYREAEEEDVHNIYLDVPNFRHADVPPVISSKEVSSTTTEIPIREEDRWDHNGELQAQTNREDINSVPGQFFGPLSSSVVSSTTSKRTIVRQGRHRISGSYMIINEGRRGLHYHAELQTRTNTEVISSVPEQFSRPLSSSAVSSTTSKRTIRRQGRHRRRGP